MNGTYNGKNWRGRLICLLLAMALLSPGLGAEAEALSAKYMYTTLSNVMFRPQPGTTDYIDRLPSGWPLERLSETTVNGDLWYQVKAKSTPTFPSREYTGYVRANVVRMMTAAEETAYLAGTGVTPSPSGGVTPTQAPAELTGYVKLNKYNVNLRRTPGGESMTQIPINTILPFYGLPLTRAGYQWVYVVYNGIWGYVRGDCYTFTDASGNPAPAPSSQPTPPPTNVTEPPVVSPSGTIRLTKGGVNLRKTPGGESLLQMPNGMTLNYSGQPVSYGGYQWVYAQHAATGTWGYVRSDCYVIVTSGSTPAPTAPPSGSVGYIITTIGTLNVRTSPSLNATTFTQLPNAGVTFPYSGIVSGGGREWYHITYNNRSAYILTTYARVTTAAPTATPGAPTPTVNPADLSSTAVTTMDRVLVREQGDAGARTLTILYTKNSVAKLTGQTNASGGFTWRQVNADGVTGWIRGDLLRILTKLEEAQLNNTGNPNLPQEATYRTLRRGDKGTDVSRLQTELSKLGFLPASGITGTYTIETSEAVKAYQRVAGLAVDGVAGPLTQHRMYGTVPVGSNNPGGTVDPALYPIEKEAWTAVDKIWQRGMTAVLTDVKTGLSFRAKRWAGGSHADVEPLTAADTAVMCRIFGVTSAQQIADKNLYQRKATWATVNGHTYAASVYGVPHNYPAGDTIANNDFNGQFCVHFVGSTTHNNPNTPDADHQKAIQEAYDKFPAVPGKK